MFQPLTEKDIARFWSKVLIVEGDGCWEWQTGCFPQGYGAFARRTLGGKPQNDGAHRVSFLIAYGWVPTGYTYVVDHECRNRRCVRPNHLRVITTGDNIRAGESPGARNAAKTHCPKGHPYDSSNTYVNPRTSRRSCRTCMNAAGRAWRARRDHRD